MLYNIQIELVNTVSMMVVFIFAEYIVRKPMSELCRYGMVWYDMVCVRYGILLFFQNVLMNGVEWRSVVWNAESRRGDVTRICH